MPELEGTATLSQEALLPPSPLNAEGTRLHLTILWSRLEPERIGECCGVSRSALLGRGPDVGAGEPPKVEFARVRPGEVVPTGALTAATLSRRQWRLTLRDGQLEVVNLGKRALLHNGLPVQQCVAKPEDTLAVDGVLLMWVSERPRVLLPSDVHASFEFGAPDEHGIIGETPEVWELRRSLAHLAKSSAHVLVWGSSGSGKELCAQAIHQASPRGGRTLTARNAATIPASLVEAELFGQARNYPNAGSPAREGLVGLAHLGTLLLDEIGELPEAQQASLLRLLDCGEYQRLGDDQLRTSDVRVIAATNRPKEALKPDLLGRFTEHLDVPDLNARKADIPLLIRRICAKLAQDSPEQSPPTATLELVDVLCRHEYTLHFRELERLVRIAFRASRSGQLELSSALRAQLCLTEPSTPLDAERVRVVLAQSKSASEAAKQLGLSSRFALYRLLKRLGIQAY
jgi:transcriptional regulator with AAA-type ATPase domain